MTYKLKIFLFILLVVILLFGLVTRWMYRAIKQAAAPTPEITICRPSFWNQHSFYVFFPFCILGIGPVALAYLALTQLDGDALLLCLLLLIPWAPAVLIVWIYYSYWKRDQHCTLRIFRQQNAFEYTRDGLVSYHAFSDVRNLTCYRSKRARGGACIFYTEVELADSQHLIMSCLLTDFKFIKPEYTASWQTVARWFSWLPSVELVRLDT